MSAVCNKFQPNIFQVDCIVTTAGGIEEDIIKCLAPTYVGDFHLPGKELRRVAINRIGNLLIPNDNYCLFEKWIMPILDQLLVEQKEQVHYFGQFVWLMGKFNRCFERRACDHMQSVLKSFQKRRKWRPFMSPILRLLAFSCKPRSMSGEREKGSGSKYPNPSAISTVYNGMRRVSTVDVQNHVRMFVDDTGRILLSFGP